MISIRFRNFLIVVIIALLSTTLMGCEKEKTSANSSGTYPHYQKSELLKERPLVFKGVVTKRGESYMRNPDGTITSEYGGPIANYQTTEYTIQIQELYKGSYTDETILLKINNVEFKGTDIYNKLSLRSTDFEIKLLGKTIEITTKGYGHGVGMSQYGALGMALEGYTYEEILSHYYF